MKKIIDQNGRLYGKISVIDVAVIIVALVMVIALAVKGTIGASEHTMEGTGSGNSEQATGMSKKMMLNVGIYVNNVPNYVAEHLRVGDELLDASQSTIGPMGVIEKIVVTPGTKQVALPNGTIEMAEVEGHSDLHLVLFCEKASMDGYDFYVKGNLIGVNTARTFTNPYVTISGNIEYISVVEGIDADEEEEEDEKEIGEAQKDGSNKEN